MPIKQPGQKMRWHHLLSKKGSKRNVTAVLSLTAMVDMFTVLVVFLLQNYDTSEGGLLYIPEDVTLPKATITRELKPNNVVTVSRKEVLLGKTVLMNAAAVRAQKDWMVVPLKAALEKQFAEMRAIQAQNLGRHLKQAVNKGSKGEEADENAWRKVTIQADKSVDFLTVKKVMYTATEAGAAQVNFAVIKDGE